MDFFNGLMNAVDMTIPLFAALTLVGMEDAIGTLQTISALAAALAAYVVGKKYAHAALHDTTRMVAHHQPRGSRRHTPLYRMDDYFLHYRVGSYGAITWCGNQQHSVQNYRQRMQRRPFMLLARSAKSSSTLDALPCSLFCVPHRAVASGDRAYWL